jgi:hypothetical protein
MALMLEALHACSPIQDASALQVHIGELKLDGDIHSSP